MDHDKNKEFESLLIDPHGMPRVDYLKCKRDFYKEKLAEIDRALELIEKNPPLGELWNLLSRI